MKNTLNKFSEKLKSVIKTTFIYVVIASSAAASFFVGMYYQNMNSDTKKHEITKIVKRDVVLALDENNNLIVIQKNNGDYTIYQDSIGKHIFNLYANSVWNHNTKKTE
jgi:hypothetical protein